MACRGHHTGYDEGMSHSLLLVQVPEVDRALRPRPKHSLEYLYPDREGTAAHITLLDPFADLDGIDAGLLSELQSFFAEVLPFAFALVPAARPGDGGTTLSVEPAAPFRQLRLALGKRFPEFARFGGGQSAEVLLHVSEPISERGDMDRLGRDLARRLPISAHAREASLCWRERGRSRILATFVFGTTAA